MVYYSLRVYKPPHYIPPSADFPLPVDNFSLIYALSSK